MRPFAAHNMDLGRPILQPLRGAERDSRSQEVAKGASLRKACEVAVTKGISSICPLNAIVLGVMGAVVGLVLAVARSAVARPPKDEGHGVKFAHICLL
jgi:hypothetical protein